MRLAALALLLAAPAALAQSAPDGPTGFVVTAAGDTLRGEVLSATEAEYARGVAFRPAPGAEAMRFGPADAVAFVVGDGRRYRRGLFQVRAAREVTPSRPNDRLAFARVVRDGDADLLALETTEGRPTFYVQTDGAPIGLWFVEKEVGGRLHRSRPLYRQTLLAVLGTCGVPEAVYAGLGYTEPAIARVVDAYNVCQDASYTAQPGGAAVRRATTVTFEVGADVAVGSFRRRGVRPATIVDPGVSSFQVRAGAEIAPTLLPHFARIVVGTEYAHDVARMYRSDFKAQQLNTLHGVLGARLAGRVGGLGVHVGTGLMIGTVLDRTVASVSAEDAVRFVPSAAVRSSGGQYVEAGVAVPRTSVWLAVRAEATSFGGGPSFLPLFSGSTLGTRTVSAGVHARL
ncbi:hypothetical protein RQM47_12270 [Rubrivirga sp. S365]|uniref:Uncharacterized protein n=1 Tax=Rubrivirga litoralis TaxID=3075598 RepID=A0ABU3BNK1_9BACT|nr:MULTISPECIES: hypothetical protein [unclassified Rubrivirga]MDT0630867.1 hypothetical protein [Rubrivirga sp. F394]MDT7857419.1 hypothetical protein [Rubrivirga sp. S365]